MIANSKVLNKKSARLLNQVKNNCIIQRLTADEKLKQSPAKNWKTVQLACGFYKKPTKAHAPKNACK
jgi:hypothetical protein